MSADPRPEWADAIASFEKIEPEERRDPGLVRGVTVWSEHDCWDRCAFDKPTCKPHTGGWHGIGSRRIFWYVAVPGRGAVSQEMFTPIYTETALLRGGALLRATIDDWHPLGGLNLHYAKPPDYLADCEPRQCDWIEGDCWSDFTSLQADNAFDCYVAGGTLAVWSWLAEQWLPGVLNRGS